MDKPKPTVEKFVDPALGLILKACGGFLALWSLALLFAPVPLIRLSLRLTYPGPDFERFFAPSSLLVFLLRSSGVWRPFVAASFFIAARDPAGHAAWIRTAGVFLLVLSALCAVSPLLHPPGHPVFILEAILAAIGGAFILRFARRPLDLARKRLEKNDP